MAKQKHGGETGPRYKTPGEIIGGLLEKSGVSAYALGLKIGLDPDTIRRMVVNGGEGIQLETWRRVCAGLGVDPWEHTRELPPVDLSTAPRRPVGRPKKISE